MSSYIEAYGDLVYKTEEAAQKVRDALLDGGWLEQRGDKLVWMEERMYPIDEQNAWTHTHGKSVWFNGGIQRNLGRMFDDFINDDLDAGMSTLRVFCGDGGFDLSELRHGELEHLEEEEVSELLDCPGFYGRMDEFYENDEMHHYEDKAYNWLLGA